MVRDIFLDNDRALASIRRQLARTVARARGHGHAIAIGHPYPETLDALESWLPRLAAQGLVLVSALVSAPTSPAVSTRKVGDTGGPAVRPGAIRRKSRSKIGLAPSRRATP